MRERERADGREASRVSAVTATLATAGGADEDDARAARQRRRQRRGRRRHSWVRAGRERRRAGREDERGRETGKEGGSGRKRRRERWGAGWAVAVWAVRKGAGTGWPAGRTCCYAARVVVTDTTSAQRLTCLAGRGSGKAWTLLDRTRSQQVVRASQ